MQKSWLAVLLSAAFLLPVAAQAEGHYVKLGGGQSQHDFVYGPTEDETAMSIAYGMAMSPNVDVELGYINFGKFEETFSFGTASLKAHGVYAAAIGKLPVAENLSLLGKVGLIYAYSDYKEIGYEESEDRTAPLAGVGLEYRFSQDWAAGVDYTYFQRTAREINHAALQVSVKYGF